MNCLLIVFYLSTNGLSIFSFHPTFFPRFALIFAKSMPLKMKKGKLAI